MPESETWSVHSPLTSLAQPEDKSMPMCSQIYDMISRMLITCSSIAYRLTGQRRDHFGGKLSFVQ